MNTYTYMSFMKSSEYGGGSSWAIVFHLIFVDTGRPSKDRIPGHAMQIILRSCLLFDSPQDESCDKNALTSTACPCCHRFVNCAAVRGPFGRQTGGEPRHFPVKARGGCRGSYLDTMCPCVHAFLWLEQNRPGRGTGCTRWH